MLALLNNQLVMVEVATWAHLRLADILKISRSDCAVRWEYLPDTMRTTLAYSVDLAICPDVDEATLKEVYRSLDAEVKSELDYRLRGLRSSRSGYRD